MTGTPKDDIECKSAAETEISVLQLPNGPFTGSSDGLLTGERLFVRKLDCRMFILVIMYILNYVSEYVIALSKWPNIVFLDGQEQRLVSQNWYQHEVAVTLKAYA